MNQQQQQHFHRNHQQLHELARGLLVDIFSSERRQAFIKFLQENNSNSTCKEIISASVSGDCIAQLFTAAADQKHFDVMSALLDNGINVDVESSDGFNALFTASFYGHEEVARFLLDANANVDQQASRIGWTALLQAAVVGKRKVVEMLLEKNANVDIQNNDGETALMHAVLGCFKEIVQLLLDHNADVDLKDNDGKTALDLAEDEEIKEMIQNHVSVGYILK